MDTPRPKTAGATTPRPAPGWRFLAGNSLILLSFSAAGTGLSYVYQVLMGRLLGPEGIAEIGIVFAVFAIVGAFFSPWYTAIGQLSARLRNEEPAALAATLRTAARALDASAVGLLLLFAANAILLHDLLHLSFAGVWVLAVTVMALPRMALHNGLLLGRRSFKALGTANLVGSIVRFAAGLLLVLLGLGPIGAILGIALGAIASVLFSWRAAPTMPSTADAPARLGDLGRLALPIVLSSAALASLSNIDFLLVRTRFTEHESGLYAGAMALLRVFHLLPLAIGQVIFPILSESAARKQRLHVLAKAAALYLVGAVAGLLVLWAATGTIIDWTLGPAFRDGADLVRAYSTLFLPFGLLGLLTSFCLAVGSSRFVWWVGAIAAAEWIGLWRFADSVADTILIAFVFTNAALLVTVAYALLGGPRAPAPAGPGRPAVIVDRDGTLNEDPGYIHDPRDLRLRPGVAEGVAVLAKLDVPIVVVTNQGGIARGKFTEQQMHAFHAALEREVRGHGGRLDAFYWCPHHPQGVIPELTRACDCRKPEPGLLLRAAREHGIDLSRSYVIGDTSRDLEAARRVGAQGVLVPKTPDEPRTAADWVAGDFLAAARLVERALGSKAKER